MENFSYSVIIPLFCSSFDKRKVKKGLQISFNSLNKGLDACIQQLQELTQTVFLDEAIQDFQKVTEAYKKFRKILTKQKSKTN